MESSSRLHAAFKDAYDKIRSGELKTLIPFLCLFRLNGKPMTLKMHYQFAPMFNTVQAANTVYMCGRQLGKSYSVCSSVGLRNMLVPFYHTVLIQPRADQIQRLNSTVYRPLIGSSPVVGDFITNFELSKMALKAFNNGSMCYMEHMFSNADRLRGLSGAAATIVDESMPENTLILSYDLDSKRFIKKKISEISAKNVLLSFDISHDKCILSVAAKDASFHGIRDCFRIRLASGNTISCTIDHALPTSRGRLRLQEIIEYEFIKRSKSNRDVGAAIECDSGVDNGRCVSQAIWEYDKIAEMEPQLKTEIVCGSQVPSITRVRNEASVRGSESWARRFLDSIDIESPWDTSLCVSSVVSEWSKQEDNNQGVPGPDISPNSFGMVVHGRWDQTEKLKCRAHRNEQLLSGRTLSSEGLAAISMGNCCNYQNSNSQLDRESVALHCTEQTLLHNNDETDSGLHTGLYEIQDDHLDSRVSDLRSSVTEECGHVLFSCLRTRIQETIEEDILREEQEAYTANETGMERSPQRPCEPACERTLQKPSCREEGNAECTCQRMGSEEQRSGKRTEAGSQGCHEGRSCVRGKTKGRACQILCKEEGGSCKIRKNVGVGQNCQKEAGTKSKRTGIPEEVATRESGEVQGEASQTECQTTAEECREERGQENLKNGFKGNFYLDRIISVEYIGELPVYDLEIVGTHNYILANGVCSYNCQDIEYELIDIANETMSASMFWGFSIYTGTPKTTDTTLALLWDRSSKAEWVIRCEHCNHFNVPNPDHDLLKMIGKYGAICAKCGKPVKPQNGGFVHAIPERGKTFPGYHISQTIHPLHLMSQAKWNKLLYKLDNYAQLTLYNEVLGWPYDAATAPLSLADLQKATHDIPELKYPSDIEGIAHLYRYITVGVDWSGGGMISDSYTSFAVLGLRANSDIIDVLYGKRIPKGVSPTDEANEILNWISGTGADAFAYDNGGSGYARLEIMKHCGLHSIPGLTIIPINYVRPHAGDVMQPHTHQREADMYYYTLDKSRSLAISTMSIKSCRIRFPKFDEREETHHVRDWLALREDPRKSLGNETVILIIKKPGVPDDFAHAVNFGCSQIWDHFGAYPRIGAKYDAAILDFDENNNKILPDEVFGPRGDWERFKDAVEMRASVISPEYSW